MKPDSPRKYPVGAHPDLPPPVNTTGPMAWMRINLFSSPLNTALTFLSLWILWTVFPPFLDWAILESIWSATDRKDCWAKMPNPREGACWAFIRGSFEFFVYGWYPDTEKWRVNLSFILLILAIVGVLKERIPGKKYWLWFASAFPFVAAWLLIGGFGFEYVETSKLGGILLTIIIGITGISFSLPIGIVLALGRRSNMPALRSVCVIFIEFIRGVPLITLLFVASTMLTYFLPPGSTFDLLMRVLIMVTLFSSAYIAEVVRGGLQGLPTGQYEAADSLGLTYWKAHRLIILPQALKISIPGIVNTFIGLYKDTTLVLIIGMMDIVGLGRARLNDPEWLGLAPELYFFIAVFFFLCCFSMARYSLNLEKKLSTSRLNT
ncbi:MAG: amino acid ABC transporter permease [SAR324 cluster bacterium]|jgi:general L-amino acid transport system permease protein|nr:amino acid ABC transporter permease [SAR324 cluster bacterium]MDP6638201.1 amino acid ABC transporter permease [SAR324 cluster bacterium]MDP7501599.1 amino acid ABC transporter permease [SAR324 cluster bacterium]MDP7621419.1 amino acid ABC transporter permease [SAR324 cluster bacterium]|tara:strand:+ start:2738 stop:3871 length:1134 start_codon:yes stop_codon:yes gene_type:complete